MGPHVGTSTSVTETLGRYRLGERIGSGGTADVYRAEVQGAAGFAKTLVIKRLRPHVADEPALVEGLAREAKLARRLHHGNIVQVLDFGVEDGQPYVVMEHVDGCSLHELRRDLLRRGERMGLGEALFVVEELCAALRYVHGLTDDDGVPLRLVHRDVKPRNVLVSREGVVKLTDFGIAKLAGEHEHTLPGVIKGTPGYLAPEQARGGLVDARTDVYALGLLLRELVLDAHDDAPPLDPRVDDELRRLCERATAQEPEQRPGDVQALLGALQRWRAARELEASPGRLPTWVRRVRRQAPATKPIALDGALLGDDGRGATRAQAAAPSEPSPWRRRWPALAVALGLVGGAWALRAEPSAEPGSDAAQPPASTATPVVVPPRRTEPEPMTKPEPRGASTLDPTPEPTREASAPAPTEPSTPAPAPSEPSAASPEPPAPEPRPRPPAKPGRLQVNVLPWAEVSVDGRSLGRVPIDVELPAGRHRVRLSNPRLGDRSFTIELSAGGLHKITQW